MNSNRVVKSFECMNACIINHMNQAGIKITGSDIFFAGDGFPIHYKKKSLTGIFSEGFEANFRFLKKYGIDYRYGIVSPTKENMLKFLKQPYTVTIRMVSDFLTYDRVFSQTSGASHFINILEYNQEKRQFFVVDGDVPSIHTGCFSGWIDEADILSGWREKRGEILQLKLVDDLSEDTFFQQVRKDANRQVEKAVDLYLNGKKKIFTGQAHGEQAIFCMIHQLKKYINKREFKYLVNEANFRIRVDGYLGAKYFFLEKFREQQKKQVAKDYQELIEGWSKWCMLLLKSGIVATAENFSFVEKRMEELIKWEKKILQRQL